MPARRRRAGRGRPGTTTRAASRTSVSARKTGLPTCLRCVSTQIPTRPGPTQRAASRTSVSARKTGLPTCLRCVSTQIPTRPGPHNALREGEPPCEPRCAPNRQPTRRGSTPCVTAARTSVSVRKTGFPTCLRCVSTQIPTRPGPHNALREGEPPCEPPLNVDPRRTVPLGSARRSPAASHTAGPPPTRNPSAARSRTPLGVPGVVGGGPPGVSLRSTPG
jgi:hypothetical protein